MEVEFNVHSSFFWFRNDEKKIEPLLKQALVHVRTYVHSYVRAHVHAWQGAIGAPSRVIASGEWVSASDAPPKSQLSMWAYLHSKVQVKTWLTRATWAHDHFFIFFRPFFFLLGQASVNCNQ